MKKILFSLLFVGMMMGMQAKPVDVETAKSLGIRFMNVNTEIKSAQAQLAYTAFADNGQTCFYVFTMQPKGFVIVSADDRMRPILGYSSESSFGIPDEENGLQVFFDAYRCDLNQAIAMDLQQSTEVAEQWNSLNATGRLVSRRDRSVGPLLSTTWHQTQLYNYQCPEDPEGYDGHVKVGCVANGMSQIMRYWEWPKTGTGSHSYFANGYGRLTANFGEADYHYELMPDFLDYTSLDAEVDAIGLLEFHTGVSVEMDYGPDGSGAYSSDVPDALQDYFRYSEAMVYNDRDYFSDSQWIDLLIDEFDNGRPVYYSAYSYIKDGTRGGHAFVCDGYDEYQFMHFNWGWQGFDNGFYSINAMNLTHHQYNYSHYALTNVVPDEEYYDQPKPVSDVEIIPLGYGSGVHFAATAPTETMGGMQLTDIDSVVLLLNGELLHVFEAPQPGERLEYEGFPQNIPHGYMDCFIAYPVTSVGRGKAVVDTIAMWTGGKPLIFHLHDAVGDGWLSPAISVLADQRVLYRIGLEGGYEDTITVNLPLQAEITLFWNYCNVGYEDDDEECSFEVYDWKGEQVYVQTTKPVVGELHSFINEVDYMLPPDFITAQYEYLEDGRFGVHVYWGMENPNQWLRGYELCRYTDLSGLEEAVFFFMDDVTDYFDEVSPGTYYYRVVAEYNGGGGAWAPSDPALNLDDPELDYAMVEVTSVGEQSDGTFVYPNPVSNILHLTEKARVEVVNALGQIVFSGETSTIDVSDWDKGVYLLRTTTENGRCMTQKIIKK